jgi:hypothetical protein
MLRPVILTILLLSAAFAQTSTSSIAGIVSDATGALVAGATVQVENEATGVANRQTTTEAGLYAFPALPVGSYAVTVEMTGFKKARKNKNVLTVGTPLVVNVVLELGDLTETVTVESRADTVETSSATLGNVVTQKAIVELPLNGRNPLTLLTLEPGVVQRSNGGAGTGVHVNGSRDMSHNVTIDGIEANESSVNNPTNNVYRLNPDNVQEYKVTTSNATAEEGRNSGASVSVATRSGTNRFRGTLFNFFRNTALNANEFFANALGNPKPDMKLNQYGFELGGPIRKNRTFFFFSRQGQNINISQPIDQVFGSTPTVFTGDARRGIFRYFVANPNSPLRLDGETLDRNSPRMVDSRTGALRPELRSCASPTDAGCVATFNFAANDPLRLGVDPVVGRLLSRIPLPNSFVTGDGLNTASYLWNPPYRVRGPSYLGRIDHKLTDFHSIWGRWLQADNNTLGGDPNNSRPQLYPGLPPMGEVYRASKSLAVGLRSTFSPRLTNELTLGFSRFVFLFTQGEANPDFPNVPSFARAPGTGATNAFNLLDTGLLNTPRTYRAVTTPQILNNVSYLKGQHFLKGGFNFRFYRHNDQRGQPGGVNVTPLTGFAYTVRPPQGFNTPAPSRPGVAGIHPTDNNRLFGLINDVMGIPARITQTYLGDLSSDSFLPYKTGNSVSLWSMGHRLKQYNFFLQDEWKLRKSLTLNFGLRWEVNPPPSEAHGRVYVPDAPITGSSALVGFTKANRWFQRMNWGALGPRVALAWSPREDWVVRAGYGIAYDTISSFQVTAVSGRVPGLTVQCSSTVGGAATPGCGRAPDLRIGQGFPDELPPPTVKPSSFLRPAAQLLTNAPTLSVFDQNLRVPTVHQWNLNVQKQVGGGFVAQLGYVARRGTRLYRAYDINQVNADGILPSFLAMQENFRAGCQPDGTGCPGGVRPVPVPVLQQGIVNAAFVNSAATQNDLRLNAAGTLAGRIEQTTLAARLRPNQQFGTITYLDSGGDSYYHSIQASLRKRFSRGLMAGIAYTFGKSIDNQSVDPVAASSGGGLSTTNSRTPTDIRDWRLERARSDFDRTHVLTANFVYDLPFGRGRLFASGVPGALNHLIGGWSLNGLTTFMTGEPFSVRSGVRTANFSHESRAAVGVPKPEAKLVEKAGIAGPLIFASSDGFAIPSPGANGAGRNIFNSPSFFNADLSVSKRFGLREGIALQFRAETFNILNHPNFDNPRDASVGTPSMTSTLFGQTCCATVSTASSRSIIQTGESARVVQFALKLQF